MEKLEARTGNTRNPHRMTPQSIFACDSGEWDARMAAVAA